MIRTKGPQCIQVGFPVVAVAKGKKCPTYKGWQERPLTVEDCAKFDDSYGVGILTGVGDSPVYALDVDVEDAALASEFRAYLQKRIGRRAPLMYRVGNAPKFLVPIFCWDAGITKCATAHFEKDGLKARLEILGAGQQFVAYHIHPETGRPYQWYEGEIANFYPDLLPAVDAAAFKELLDAFSQLAESRGYRPVSHATTSTTVFSDSENRNLAIELTPITPPLNLSINELREVLEKIPLNLGPGTHDEWVRLGMALHHQTQGSQEGLALWDEVSSRFPDAYEPGACAKRWKTFNADKSGGVTFRSYYKTFLNLTVGDSMELSLDGLYLRALEVLEGKALFLYDANDWLFFDGSKWVEGPGEALVFTTLRKEIIEQRLEMELQQAVAVNDQMRVLEIKKFRKGVRNKISSVLTNLLTMLRKTSLLNTSYDTFDMNPRYFGVLNGVLDLDTRELLPNTPEMHVLRRAQYPYDPTATCPTFERALLEWMDGSTAKVEFLQRLIGQALTGKRLDNVFLLARGGGCNGKSVFINTMANLFGGYSEVIGEDTLVGFSTNEGGRARADLAKLHGARFVYCSETSENRTMRESDVKRMTSREPFAARRPFGQKEQVIVPTWLLCVGTNYPPRIRGDDDGVWRRVADVEFPRNFEKDPNVKLDPLLTDKLQAELPGILNWALKGLTMYQETGLAMPPAVIASTAQYRDESNLVLAWKNDALVPQDNAFHSTQELYDHFIAWLRTQGEKTEFTKTMFSRRLNRLIKPHRTIQARGFIGHTFKKSKDFKHIDFDIDKELAAMEQYF